MDAPLCSLCQNRHPLGARHLWGKDAVKGNSSPSDAPKTKPNAHVATPILEPVHGTEEKLATNPVKGQEPPSPLRAKRPERVLKNYGGRNTYSAEYMRFKRSSEKKNTPELTFKMWRSANSVS